VQEPPRAAGSTIQPGNLSAELRSVLQSLCPTACPAEIEATRVFVTDA
jgi:hypothetical protein